MNEKSLKLEVSDLTFFQNKAIYLTMIFILVLLSSASTFFKSYYGTFISIFLIIGILIFLISQFYIKENSDMSVFFEKKSYLKLLVILFFMLVSINVGYLYFFDSFYQKSLFYYICIGFSSLIIFLISLQKLNINLKFLMPFLLVILGFEVYLSNFINFPYGTYASGDTHYQIYEMVIPIFNTGWLPITAYSSFPIHQIFIAQISLITKIDPTFLYMIFIAFIFTSILIIIYTIGSKFFGCRYGIYSALFFLFFTRIIYDATHPYQFSYALPITILIFFIFLKIFIDKPDDVENTKIKYIVLYTICWILLILTHHFTSFLFMIFLVFILLVSKILFFENFKININMYLILVPFIIMLSYWLYTTVVLNNFIDLADLYTASTLQSRNIEQSISKGSILPFFQVFLNNLGTCLILMLTIVGFTYGIYKKDFYSYILGVFGITTFLFITAASYINLPTIMASRILSLIFSLCFVFLAAGGTLLLLNSFKKIGVIICCILFFLIPIVSLSATTSGVETSLFNIESSNVRFYDTQLDYYSLTWSKIYIPPNSNIIKNQAWFSIFLDKFRNYNQMIINNGEIDTNTITIGDYMFFQDIFTSSIRFSRISETEQADLIRKGHKTANEASQIQNIVTKLDPTEYYKFRTKENLIYSTNKINSNKMITILILR